ncbi:MAG: MJ1255/VC2487 family glycosyltransferase [Nanoarchaeota archaeon]
MAKIIYGVAGEGMGHATRSWVIIKELMKKHEVWAVCGDSAYDFLSKKIKNILKIDALRIMYIRNKVSNIKTMIYNLKTMIKGRKISLEKVNDLVADFKPDLVISDFEYFSSLIAKKNNLPLVVIDNNHISNKAKVTVPKLYFKDYLVSKMIANIIARKAKYFLITTFFYPKIKEKNVSFYPPILRDKIIKLKPSVKDYILVYQTSKSYTKLIPTLKKIDEKFIAYSIRDDGIEENITFKKFGEEEFFNDLKDCKAVISNGGYSLMGEALYLDKPILSIPIGGQFEQILNALYLKKLGYGLFSKRISKKIVEKFLSDLDHYRANIKKHKKEDNSRLFKKIESIIQELEPHEAAAS